MSNNSPVSTAPPKAQPVRNVARLSAVITAVLAALVLPTALNAPEAVRVTFAWVVFAGGIVKVALDAWQSQSLPQQVVPFKDTAAYINEDGVKVAGPASALKNGVPVSELEHGTADAAMAALEGQTNAAVTSLVEKASDKNSAHLDPLSHTPTLAPVVEEDADEEPQAVVGDTEPGPGDILISEDSDEEAPAEEVPEAPETALEQQPDTK